MILNRTYFFVFIGIFFLCYFPSNVISQCSNEFTVAKFGVEYLRLNGSNDLWSCNNTNLCARITALESTIATLQQQLLALTATRPSVSAYINTSSAVMNSDQVLLPVKFDTEQYDTTNSYDPSTGIFTVPSTGKYLVNAAVAATPVNGAKASEAQMILCKNGGTLKRLFRLVLGADGLNDQMPAGSAVADVNQGDQLTIGFSMTTTVVTTSSWMISPDLTENYIQINKIS